MASPYAIKQSQELFIVCSNDDLISLGAVVRVLLSTLHHHFSENWAREVLQGRESHDIINDTITTVGYNKAYF